MKWPLFLLLLLAACTAKDEVEIGLLTPLSGRLAVLGETVQQATQLAVEDLNRAGGISERRVVLLVEDTSSDVTGAVSGMRRLVAIEKVPLVLEAASSGEAAAVAPLAEEHGVVHLSILATTQALEDAGPYVFKMRESADAHMRTLSGAMVTENVSSLAVLALNDEYCKNMVDRLDSQWDLPEVVAREWFGADEVDLRSQVLKIKQVRAEGVFVCGFYPELGRAFRQLHESEVAAKFFSVTTFEHPLVKEMAGENALEGVIYTVSALDCERTSFCARYEAQFGVEPDYRAAYSYDAVIIAVKALQRTRDPDELKEVLLETSLDGVSGTTSFDEHGNARKEVLLRQVRGGDWSDYVLP